ncbi:short-chain dehydrogenase [Pedobacter yulinensis]|uniref:Short-chain dehydrogenase n=1 Tax=Pedobacter yulinensis TaxID=2126353 RepID=A0A2T3HQ11_9SPHI|nr:SDR family oxidoreductase [Pedobacter yulinensis]PST84555.1 short-chain dehydrogenase [Pedobacter yulinensis]
MNAVITGATRGVGRAIAAQLAADGYDLAVCARNTEELGQLKTELERYGRTVHTFAADAASKKELQAFADAVAQRFQTIDVVVNNVGVFFPGSLLDEADERFETQLQINLLAAYYMAKFFGNMMRNQRSGHLFTIGSVASKRPEPNAGSYSVTKAALLSLNDVLRQELAPYHVKVTAVLPGSTYTSSWEGTTLPKAQFVQPEDIAQTISSVLRLSPGANVEEIVIRPLQFQGDSGKKEEK